LCGDAIAHPEVVMESFDTVLARIRALPPGTMIPKPRSDQSSSIDGWGTRRGQDALVYRMPNHRNPARPHGKGVTISGFRDAFGILDGSGQFTRAWYQGDGTCRAL
jgi:hypothetical protein